MPPLLFCHAASNSARPKTLRTLASSGANGSFITGSPVAVNPTITMRCPLVPYPAPGTSFFLNAADTTTGMPAAMNRSTSVKSRIRLTNASSPNRPA